MELEPEHTPACTVAALPMARCEDALPASCGPAEQSDLRDDAHPATSSGSSVVGFDLDTETRSFNSVGDSEALLRGMPPPVPAAVREEVIAAVGPATVGHRWSRRTSGGV